MNIRNLIEKIRDSQFLIPAVFIAGSLLLALLTNRLDGNDVTFDLLIPSTVAAARTLTATVAGAIITVAALVFSFSAVTVQLAASQYSPRVVGDFLRDRFQQAIVGLVMGTFTYSLTSLAALGADASEGSSADWTASTAIVLGIAGALSIVAYIDHVTRRIRIDDTVRRISERTEAAFSSRKKVDGAEPGSWNLLPTSASSCIRAGDRGSCRRSTYRSSWLRYLRAPSPDSTFGPATSSLQGAGSSRFGSRKQVEPPGSLFGRRSPLVKPERWNRTLDSGFVSWST